MGDSGSTVSYLAFAVPQPLDEASSIFRSPTVECASFALPSLGLTRVTWDQHDHCRSRGLLAGQQTCRFVRSAGEVP